MYNRKFRPKRTVEGDLKVPTAPEPSTAAGWVHTFWMGGSLLLSLCTASSVSMCICTISVDKHEVREGERVLSYTAPKHAANPPCSTFLLPFLLLLAEPSPEQPPGVMWKDFQCYHGVTQSPALLQGVLPGIMTCSPLRCSLVTPLSVQTLSTKRLMNLTT